MASPDRFNALRVITDTYLDLGVIGATDTLSAALAQDGLRRLNRLISQLRTQEFSCPFIGRQVFPITASKNTYTIGPGGDCDTQRPQQVTGVGLLLRPTIASFSVTAASITASTFTVAGDQTGSFPSGSDFLVSGSTGNDGSYTIIGAVYGSGTVITVNETVRSTVADGTIQVFGESNSTTEIPISLMTDNAYQALQVKGMTNTQFTGAYYNATYAQGLGTLWLWPKPVTGVNSLVLYLDQQIDGFADLVTDYWFPPGYADLFEYGLAMRMAPPSTIANPTVLQLIKEQFTTSAFLVKRSNVPLNDMPTDAGQTFSGQGAVWNILTGGTR